MIATAVIADDEPLARHKLQGLLAEVSWISCVGEAADGLQTVELTNRLRPDLLFLDIRMPGLSGLDVLFRLTHSPTVVFTTAHDEYAVTAFELRAMDYLLKPFGRERFLETIARIRESLHATVDASAVERGREALKQAEPLRRLFVRANGRIAPVAIEEVTRFEAQGDYVAIHTLSGRHLAALRMGDLEGLLEEGRFLRVHRSHIVNLDHVKTMVPHASDRLLLTMSDGTELFASRSRSRELRKRTV
jgi:two-component system, LytTR family, response regulator